MRSCAIGLVLVLALVASAHGAQRAPSAAVAAGHAAPETPVAAPDGGLAVHLRRVGGSLEVHLELLRGVPERLREALPSGAQLRVLFPIRVRGRRRLLWDRRVWRGELTSTVAFDPITGRYRCELLLDGVVIATRETTAPDVALDWLRSPPPFRVVVPATRRRLYVRVRAVFSTGTTWLVFPSARGTGWVTGEIGEGS